MRDDARVCHAQSKRSGKPCRQNCLLKPDGSYTKNCRFHNGEAELRAPGDPRNGGHPGKHFGYGTVIPQAYRHVYEAALRQLGKLDHELALARTNLYRFQEKQTEQEKGGVPTSISGGGTSVSLRTYEQIVGDYLDRIARLEDKRASVLQKLQSLDVPPPPVHVVVDGERPDETATEEVRARLREKLLHGG